ncbi:hypothetical protein LTR47_009657 [Exophiala xenobiotica]|nr:hypothetical protein LTR41_007326 [Exophiala xenobiotica]KAK5225054.1 hypothetical protein LTR47_009657 [Exophiala xenobiotica]KAK5250550.1 hypothetical protein LTS06_004613 [Exophiala xenobiotica]KAK5262313.1 hypothetical protein LTR40_000438 [Exophiala xenobiotica]KAK5346052.1 hypothetical protein LTR61_010267 [Exophiala xenobiotica]
MQLHRLDSSSASSASTALDQALQLEVKRRIWCFLVIQDTYLIAAKKTYNIILEHCTTSLPAHIEEPAGNSNSDELNAVPLETVTQNSYILLHYNLSRVFRTLHSRTRPVPTERPSLDRLYQRVLDADEQPTDFMELAPSWVKLDEHNSEADFSSPTTRMANSQRRTFQIAFLHMRSKIHQPFYYREHIENVLQENETPPSEEEEGLSTSAFDHELDEVVGSFEFYTNSQGYYLEEFAAT